MDNLNEKLVVAIERQAELEDAMATARIELENAHKRIQELEASQEEHKQMIASGLLIQKKDVDDETDTLMRKLMEESRQRTTAVESKLEIEKELEDLTRSLFEEANKLVVVERKENAAIKERNDRLNTQLKDSEILLASHQAQLEELKDVMQKLSISEVEPTTPLTRSRWSREMSPMMPPPEPEIYGIAPRYRTDTTAFNEFLALLHVKPELDSPQRVASPANGSPHMSPAMSSLWSRYADKTSLRETKFMKRAIVEDIEPTLRLDLAPELGYLTRRAIMAAVLEGTLVVEPIPSHLSRYAPDKLPCALCSESRYFKGIERSFRLRTSDKPDSQTHMLCPWCTDRVRSVCTYVTFLRQVRDGLWKTEKTEDMRVWEESVKLRECMFWARVGHILE